MAPPRIPESTGVEVAGGFCWPLSCRPSPGAEAVAAGFEVPNKPPLFSPAPENKPPAGADDAGGCPVSEKPPVGPVAAGFEKRDPAACPAEAVCVPKSPPARVAEEVLPKSPPA